MDDSLARSIELAAHVHCGQVDKGGSPYILHALTVMDRAAQQANDDLTVVMCAAVLHDVIEETKAEKRPKRRVEVYEAAGDRAGEAVDALTRGAQESWSNYLDRVRRDWIARIVKIEDLRHNMNLGRLGCEPTAADLQRQRKYQDAEQALADYDRLRKGTG